MLPPRFGIVLILVGLVHYVIIPEEEEFSTSDDDNAISSYPSPGEEEPNIIIESTNTHNRIKYKHYLKTLVTIIPYHLLLHPTCRPTVEL